jgi:hypothetical protein
MRLPLNCQQSIRKQKGPAVCQAIRKWAKDRKAAAATGLGRYGLKADFRGDLQPTRSAASQKGIADAYVPGGRQAQGSKGPAVGADTIGRGVRDKGRKIRIREISVIEQVVGFKAQL